MHRVLIVDAHPIVRLGLRRILQRSTQELFIVEADSAAAALRSVRGNNFALVLIDVDLPDRSGLQLLAQLKRLRPVSRVLVLSGVGESVCALRCFRNGADGYLSKESSPERILAAVQRILAGQSVMSPELAELWVCGLNKLSSTTGPLHSNLSDREFEIFYLLAQGRAENQIARRLALSAKTIVANRKKILHKLQIDNRVQLMRYAANVGII